MVKANPARPFDSPIKVTHNGGDPTEYRHEANRAKLKTSNVTKQNIKQFDSIAEFQESKMESAVIDENINKAIQKDLALRNIRTKNQ